jgi:1-hydroxycarotenoid 3,4-desaturase
VLLRPGATLAGLMQASFTDPRLRQLFGRYATYVGGDPRQSPAVLALVWQAEARGVWAVRGGMAQLAQALGDLAAAQGVECRYGEAVAEIEVESGRVAAVRTASGARIRCAAAVFAGDPAALRAGLLGHPVAGAVSARATGPRSLSAWVWAFGSAPEGQRAAELVHHNVFFGRDPDQEFAPIAAGAMPEDPTLYVCAQDRGGASDTPRPPGAPERFEIIMNGPPRAPGSDREEERCRARTFATLGQRGLSFTPAPEPGALTAPADFATMFPGSRGSLYGRSPHGAMAAFSRPGPRTAIAGLYLAGGGAHPGAGVPMATLSAKHAAEAITQDLTSALASPPTAMRGGMSTASRMTGGARSRS